MFQQKKLAVLVASALTLGLGVNVALAQTFTQGPSSSATPYMNNSAVPGMNTYVGNSATPTSSSPTASFTSILTVGDAAGNGYKMAGIPDGLGAFDNGNGTFTLLMNHEIGAGLGIARGPLTNGAFVSQWVIDKSTLSVVSGQNAITNLNTWNYTTQSFVSGGTTSFSRFCSSDLAAPTAFYNSNTGLGYNGGRIYMTGEESGTAGRATATVVSGANAGQLYQLPSLGRYSFENAVANPYMQNKTIVATTDDTSGTGNGKVYIYVGDKQATGNAIEQAGLQGGQKYVIAVNGSTQETRLGGVGSATTFTLAALPDQRTVTSNTNGQANTAGGTSFLRPEDIAWDPKSPNKMYFTTTDQFDQVKDGVGATVGRSRVWRMTFSDLSNPTLGGTVEMVVDGAGPGQMFDNLVVDKDGNLILQEDVGGQAHNGKVWKFDTTSNTLSMIAGFDKARFGDIGVAAVAPFNNDEESSGVIDVTDMFTGVAGYDTAKNRYYLLDAQAHYGITGPDGLVEGGQLLLMTQPVPEPSTYALMGLGLGLMGFVARRRKQKAVQA